MGDFIESASAILATAERRVDLSAQNVSNMTTPGYKRRIAFQGMLAQDPSGGVGSQLISTFTDFSAGKLNETGNPYDLAISGDGFFAVRDGGQVAYTRAGQFRRNGDGRLVTAQGAALQVLGGGDLVLRHGEVKVTGDGTVLEDGQPVARLAIVDFTDRQAAVPGDGGLLIVPEAQVIPVSAPSVRQGALEASNTSMGEEMVAMMEAMRRAEAGQRLVNVYDDLMGRALQTFGQV